MADGDKDKFLEIFKAKVDALTVGNGMTSGVEVGPLINDKALQKVEHLFLCPLLYYNFI